MRNKDIQEWLLNEGINPEASITTINGEYYLSDILEKHLKEQLLLNGVSNRRELLIAYELQYFDGGQGCTLEMAEEMVDKFLKSN